MLTLPAMATLSTLATLLIVDESSAGYGTPPKLTCEDFVGCRKRPSFETDT